MPLSGNKVGEIFSENEHIVCKLESLDMWISIELGMVQGKYNIDANMDLKILKAMVLKDFKNLMQKLALQMWNKCVTVFEQQRMRSINKSSQIFKTQSQVSTSELRNLNVMDLIEIQKIFVLETITIHGKDEL